MANEIDANATIRIENNSATYLYKDVADLVVRIGDCFYFKHDPDLVKVKNPVGKFRFFRKNSPYIVILESGEAVHKNTAMLTEDGIWFSKSSKDIVEINGKTYRKTYCVCINLQWYLMTDTRLVKTSAGYELKDNAIQLAEKFYGKNKFVNKDVKTVNCVKGELVLATDVYSLLDGESNEMIYYHKNDPIFSRDGTFTVFEKFNDATNPQEDRVTLVSAFRADAKFFQHVDLSGGTMNFMQWVNLKSVPFVTECIEKYIMPRQSSKIEEMRTKINNLYSDLDDEENKAKSFKIVPKNWPGKSDIYVPGNYGTPVRSKAFDLTGGLKYSFGVEFETSQGLLSNSTMEELNIKAVGDRSIGSAEYVSVPLEGNGGVEALKTYCAALANKTLVDDRCGLHVHVGGLTKEKSPSFSRDFIKNSINLGCFIEQELYSTLPPNRTPTLYHCHSIRRFGDVTDKNFDLNVGAFIFGEKEKWFTELGEPKKLFSFEKYKLNADRNSHTQLGAWAEGRYKWLNLIHAFTTSAHKTIEFRIFPGTTSFNKTYMYLLLSMAFTHVVDNCPKIIKDGVTLSDVFQAAYPKHPEIVNTLNAFYNSRKKRFNRKKIYPSGEHLTFLK